MAIIIFSAVTLELEEHSILLTIKKDAVIWN